MFMSVAMISQRKCILFTWSFFQGELVLIFCHVYIYILEENN